MFVRNYLIKKNLYVNIMVLYVLFWIYNRTNKGLKYGNITLLGES